MSCSIEQVSRSVQQAPAPRRAPDANGPSGSFADLHAKALDRVRDRSPSVDLAESADLQATTPNPVDVVRDVNLPRHDLNEVVPDLNLNEVAPHDVDAKGPGGVSGTDLALPPRAAILDVSLPGGVQPLPPLPRAAADGDLAPRLPATSAPNADAPPVSPSEPATGRRARSSGGVAAPDQHRNARPDTGGVAAPDPHRNAGPDTGGVAAPTAGTERSRRARPAS